MSDDDKRHADELIRLMQAQDLISVRAYIEAHQAAMSEGTQTRLQQIAGAHPSIDTQAARQTLTLLHACRSAGLPKALADLALDQHEAGGAQYIVDGLLSFLDCGDHGPALAACVIQRPELLTEGPQDLLLQNARDTDLDEAFRIRCDQARIRLRLASLGGADVFSDDASRTFLAFDAFWQAPSWQASRDVLRSHPVLLEERAQSLLQLLQRAVHLADSEAIIGQHVELLRDCRHRGLDPAFDDFIRDLDQKRLRRLSESAKGLMACESMASLHRHVLAYPELLGDGSHPDSHWAQGWEARMMAMIDDMAIGAAATLEPEIRENVERNLAWVRRAREEGLRNVLDDAASAQMPPTVGTLLRQLTSRVIEGGLDMAEARQAWQGSPLFQKANDSDVLECLDALDALHDENAKDGSLKAWVHAELTWCLCQSVGQAFALHHRAAQSLCQELTRVFDGQPQFIEVLMRQRRIMHQVITMSAPDGSPPPSSQILLSTILTSLHHYTGETTWLTEATHVASQVLSRCPTAELTVGTKLTLGSLYLANFLGSSRLDDIEKAVELLQGGVAELTEASPHWPSAMMNLGVALRNRAGHRGMPDLDAAEEIFASFLQKAPRNQPAMLGKLLNNQGLIHRSRFDLTGSHEALDKALQCLQQAAELAPEGTWEWLNRHANLGSLLADKGRRLQDVGRLDEAIVLLRRVLDQANPELPNFPLWMVHLGDALMARHQIVQDRSDFDAAAQVYLAADELDHPGPHGEQLRAGLIKMHTKRGNLDRCLPDLQTALGMSESMLQCHDTGAPGLKALYLSLRAEALLSIHALTGDMEARRQAIRTHQEALASCEPSVLPWSSIHRGETLSALLYQDQDWLGCQDAARYALDVLADCGLFEDESSQARDHEAIRAVLLRRLVGACARISTDAMCAREALVHAEMLQADLVLSAMALSERPPPAGLPPHLVMREHAARRTLKEIQRTISLSPADTPLPASLRQAHARARSTLAEALQDIAQYPGTDEYLALRREAPPKWEDLLAVMSAVGDAAACIYLTAVRGGIVASLLKPGVDAPTVRFVELDDDTHHHRYLLPFLRDMHDHGLRRPGWHPWTALGELLFGPLMSELSCVRHLYLIVDRPLSFYPFHALNVQGEPLISRFTVTHVPSMTALSSLLKRPPGLPSHLGEFVLAMAFTPSPSLAEQAVFNEEARHIAQLLGGTALTNEDASAASLIEHAPTASIIHLSCHGHFNRESPWDSALELSGGPLHVKACMSMQLRSELVTLSACQTGISSTDMSTQVGGFTPALLYAGAKATLATLWSVHSASTLEWMCRFYEEAWDPVTKQRRCSLAQAHQAATLWMRARQPDPLYWAPFSLTGAGT